MRTKWLPGLAVLLLACSTVVFAQGNKNKGDEPSRSVQGVVTSPDDKAVAGAVVKIKNTKTLQIRSFITKDNGEYYFHGLSPDTDYELQAEFQDSASGTKTLSSFDSRKQATLNLKLSAKK